MQMAAGLVALRALSGLINSILRVGEAEFSLGEGVRVRCEVTDKTLAYVADLANLELTEKKRSHVARFELHS